jgi:metallophosphoesterase superfamily enzyme
VLSVICTLIAIGDSAGNPRNFSYIVNHIIENESRNSIIIHAGDIFDDSFDEHSIIEPLNELRENFSYFITTRGNHDPLEDYNRLFGFLPTVTDVCGNVRVISIDSNVHLLSQTTFLKEQIESSPEKTFVILLHHHHLCLFLNNQELLSHHKRYHE